ncbi:hypothetical protein AAFF_G00067470 [Aldrovandia affinis]|uniref:Uncharacterized protein n=1 Tax=Aldrovandia affinis TaxID=143900 RepID=A0AAD7WZS0_9TELE|nr:hypothetical protein AAFF_G00067470 [Aldrovandia affinis]
MTLHGIRFRNEATNLFAIMARFNALSTPAVYVWGSPALREAVKDTVWRRVCPKRKTRVDFDHRGGKKQAHRREACISRGKIP